VVDYHKPRILLTQEIHPKGIKILSELGELIFPNGSEEEELIKAAKDVEAIVTRNQSISNRVILAAPKLRVIGRHGVGLEKIDIKTATQRHVAVVYTPQANALSVAEQAIAFILVLAKRLLHADQAVRKGNFEARLILKTQELKGKVLGLIGFGAIGKLVAERARLGLGMHVLVYDPYASRSEINALGCQRVDGLKEVLTTADFISLHVPLTPETKGMIGKAELDLMKRTAFLINTARGSIVDQQALYGALKEGKIAGAGLDVFDPEPPRTNDPLLTLDNVLLSPHMASHTEEALERMGVIVAEQVAKVLKRQKPQYIANPQVLIGLRKKVT